MVYLWSYTPRIPTAHKENFIMDIKGILITFVVVVLAVKLAPKIPFLN